MTQNQKKSDDLQLTKVTLSGEAHTDPNACSSNSSQGQVLASQSHLELSSGYITHYQNPPMFGAHQSEHHQRLNQQQQPLQHLLDCHGHLEQSTPISQQNQHHLSQQIHQHQHQQTHQRLPLRENYHDIIMDDFHEEPSHAFKL